MLTVPVSSIRRRCSRFDLPRTPSASFSLSAFARKALADIHSLPPDVVDDMVSGGTLAENLSALAMTKPEVVAAARWRGLLRAVPRQMRVRARALGIREPLAILNLVEGADANG